MPRQFSSGRSTSVPNAPSRTLPIMAIEHKNPWLQPYLLSTDSSTLKVAPLLFENMTLPRQGLCDKMCPLSEIKFRIRENLLHPLEKSNGKPGILVKEYRRSAAGREVTDARQLRTHQALINTTNYLINELCSLSDVDWAVIYEFVFDRLRAIRQDLVTQAIWDSTTVYILERCVRFYLISITKLSERPPSVFDVKINSTHLQESIKQLLVLYETTSPQTEHEMGDGQYTVPFYQNRAEFESLYILFNLNHSEALHHFLSIPADVRLHRRCVLSWSFTQAVQQGNYISMFKLLHKFDELQECAVHYHLNRLKVDMLRCMNTAYSSKMCKFPLSFICDMVGNDSRQEVTSLLKQHGITVDDDHVKFLKSAWNT